MTGDPRDGLRPAEGEGGQHTGVEVSTKAHGPRCGNYREICQHDRMRIGFVEILNA
jgi:hypothetical protein